MYALTVVWLVLGIAALVAGGEALVRSSAILGRVVGLSPLVVGLTVVAFATSAPELAVTVEASLAGSAGLALGNVVGSNIANTLLVIGLSAVVLPLAVGRQLVRSDVPFLILLSALTLVLALDGSLAWADGLLLVVLLTAWVTVSVRRARALELAVRAAEAAGADGGAAGDGSADVDSPAAGEGSAPGEGSATLAGHGKAARGSGRPRRHGGVRQVDFRTLWRGVGGVVLGVALLVVGARAIVRAATEIAVALEVSDLVIGLTVVAVGTSLPEIATSVVATVRGEREMALGNAVGSSVFNLGVVLGAAAIVSRAGVPVPRDALRLDLPVMLAVSVLLLPVLYTRWQVSRWEGWLLLLGYLGYLSYLVLSTQGRDLTVVHAVLGVALSLAALLLVLAAVRYARAERAAARTS